jgi:hypothetical protein
MYMCATRPGTDVSCACRAELIIISKCTANKQLHCELGHIGVIMIELTLKTRLDGNVKCGENGVEEKLGRGSNPLGIELAFS